jgi:hypothetical protein
MAILPKVMWSERIAKKVEPFSPGVPHRGFSLVDGQPQFGHHTSRPLQGRVRMPTAQNDKVIRIGDDFRRECFRAPCQPPVLQEPVHVQVAEQRADHPALRGAALVRFSTRNGCLAVRALFLNRELCGKLGDGVKKAA